MRSDWETRISTYESTISSLPKPSSLAEAVESMHNWVSPLDRAGIRSEAEALIAEMMPFYEAGSEPDRERIRALFRRNWRFARATGPSRDYSTADGIRNQLIYFSMCDGDGDYRDAAMTLHHIIESAVAAGVDVGPMLVEVAEMSSDKRRYEFPEYMPVRDMLLARQLALRADGQNR